MRLTPTNPEDQTSSGAFSADPSAFALSAAGLPKIAPASSALVLEAEVDIDDLAALA